MSEFDFAHALIEWYQENKRDLPWRNTDDPYAIWVSEIMLQQTRVETVKPYYARFMVELPNIRALAEAEEEKLNRLWQGLGYYSRVRNMQKAAKQCVEMYGGRLPTDHAALKSLKGIGSYTAGAIASFAYGVSVPAVDGNVKRVLARYLALEVPIENKEVVSILERFITEKMPQDAPGDFNQALIELGATICGPDRAARCGGCPLLRGCRAFKEGKTERLPLRTPKAKKRVEEKTVLIVRYKKTIAMKKRPPKGLLAGLWEPIVSDGVKDEQQILRLLREQGCTVERICKLPHARHVFTHIVWEMDGYEVVVKTPGNLTFYTAEERRMLAVPSAFSAFYGIMPFNQQTNVNFL